MFNHPLAVNLLSIGITSFKYIDCFIFGFVGSLEVSMSNDVTAKLTLISWKENGWMGSRFYSWGADLSGNVSNAAETETLVELLGPFGWKIFSHL